jgi:hypothetical protein
MAYRPMGLERAVKAYFDPIDEERKRAARVRDQMFLQMGARRGLVAGQKDIAEHAAKLEEKKRLAAVERRREVDTLQRDVLASVRKPPSPKDPRYQASSEFMDKTAEELADLDHANILGALAQRYRSLKAPLTSADHEFFSKTLFAKGKQLILKAGQSLLNVDASGRLKLLYAAPASYEGKTPIAKLYIGYTRAVKAGNTGLAKVLETKIGQSIYGKNFLAYKALEFIRDGNFNQIDPIFYETTFGDVFTKAHEVNNLLGEAIGKVTFEPKRIVKNNRWLQMLGITDTSLRNTTIGEMIKKSKGYKAFAGMAQTLNEGNIEAVSKDIDRLKKIQGEHGLENFKGKGGEKVLKLWQGFHFMGKERRKELLDIAKARLRFLMDQRGEKKKKEPRASLRMRGTAGR